MDVRANLRVMVDGSASVDDDVRPNDRSGIDDCPGKHDRAFADYHVFRHDRARMNQCCQRLAVLLHPKEHVGASGIIANADHDSIMRHFIQPVAKQLGIGNISWHTFRHTYSTLLHANGEDPKVVQELLRHSSIKVTMDVYTQAVTATKRKAQSRVVEMIVPKKPAGAMAPA